MPTTTTVDRWPAVTATTSPLLIVPDGATDVAPVSSVLATQEVVFATLRRFLVTGGTSVVPAPSVPVTLAGAGPVRDAIAVDSLRVVAETLAATAAAPLRPEPLTLALAMCAAADDDLTRRAALAALPRVARTSHDLFLFATFVQGLRGWGRGLRRAIGSWYNDRPLGGLVDDVLRTPSHAGWRHADLLRLGHPKAKTPGHDALYRWLVTGSLPIDLIPEPDDAPVLARLAAWTHLRTTTDARVAAALISAHALPLDAVPDGLRSEPLVWRALLPHVPATELVDSVPSLVRTGVLTRDDELAGDLTRRLTDELASVNPLTTVIAVRSLSPAAGTRTTGVRDLLLEEVTRAARRWSRTSGGTRRLEIDPMIASMPPGPDGVRPLDVATFMALAGAWDNDPRPVVNGERLVPVALPDRPSMDEVPGAITRACADAGATRAGRAAILSLTGVPAASGPGRRVEFSSRSALTRLSSAHSVVIAGIDAGAIALATRLLADRRD